MVAVSELAEKIRADRDDGLTYKELAKKHRVSFRDISTILKGDEAEVSKEVEHKEWKKLKPLVYSLMQVQGVKTPEEGLRQAYEMQAKMNPYILYHGVKTPKNLIEHLEKRVLSHKKEKEEVIETCSRLLKEADDKVTAMNLKIEEFKQELKKEIPETVEALLEKRVEETLDKMNDYEWADRFGINIVTKIYFKNAQDRGYDGDLADYLHNCVCRLYDDLGYEISWGNVIDGRRSYRLIDPDGQVWRYKQLIET